MYKSRSRGRQRSFEEAGKEQVGVRPGESGVDEVGVICLDRSWSESERIEIRIEGASYSMKKLVSCAAAVNLVNRVYL